jgi:hypothetical protein
MITTSGIKIERESGPLPTLNDAKKLLLAEKRSSFRLAAEGCQDVPFYTIIAIVHDKNYPHPSFPDVPAYISSLSAGICSAAAPILSLFAGQSSAVVVFFFVVSGSLNILFESWDRVLKALEKELKATVCISTPKKPPFLPLVALTKVS